MKFMQFGKGQLFFIKGALLRYEVLQHLAELIAIAQNCMLEEDLNYTDFLKALCDLSKR